MAGTTYSKFFWQDWQGDNELKVCSIGAQGWWMRLLCIAGAAGNGGRVTVSGRKPTYDDLQRITGVRDSQAQIDKWEDELIRNGVCDVDPDGVLVSRRMRRAADLAHPQRAGGHKRAKTAARQGGRFAPANQLTNPPAGGTSWSPAETENAGGEKRNAQGDLSPANQVSPPATINHQPESINHQPSESAGDSGDDSPFEPFGKIAQLSEAIGWDLTAQVSGHRFVDQLVSLVTEGFDFDEDIMPAVRDARAAGKIPRDLRSLEWFRQRFESKRAQRKVKTIAAVPAADPTLSRDEWINALRTFVVVGAWVTSEWGPKPTEPGCKAPHDLLAEAERAWVNAGNHPRSAFDGNALIAWSPERSDFKTPCPFFPRAA